MNEIEDKPQLQDEDEEQQESAISDDNARFLPKEELVDDSKSGRSEPVKSERPVPNSNEDLQPGLKRQRSTFSQNASVDYNVDNAITKRVRRDNSDDSKSVVSYQGEAMKSGEVVKKATFAEQ